MLFLYHNAIFCQGHHQHSDFDPTELDAERIFIYYTEKNLRKLISND